MPFRSMQVFNPFKQNQSQKPFLSPLGECRRPLPATAAPLAVTIIGGVALVFAFGAMFSGAVTKGSSSPAAAAPAVEQQMAVPVDGAAVMMPSQAAVTEVARDEDASDRTAAIPSVSEPEAEAEALTLNVPVAENDGEIAVLEVIQLQEAEDEPEVAAEEEAEVQAVAQAQAAAASGLKPAVVRDAVNFRAAPDSKSEVLSVLPANTRIEAQTDCGWCEVAYQGQRGFVYKSFIDYR